MNVFRIEKSQKLYISLDKAWGFFSNPRNLKLITPPELQMEITSGSDEQIYQGMIITYNLKLALFFKTLWVAEITNMRRSYYFSDEQRTGPYRFWHHQHIFDECEDGVIMKDLIHYSLPLGPFGTIVNKLYIRKNLEYIFNYRKDFLEDYFPSKI